MLLTHFKFADIFGDYIFKVLARVIIRDNSLISTLGVAEMVITNTDISYDNLKSIFI